VFVFVYAPRSIQTTTPAPHRSVFTGLMPFLLPNQQHQSTEGILEVDTTQVDNRLKWLSNVWSR